MPPWAVEVVTQICTVFIGYCDYLGMRAKKSQYPINTLTISQKAGNKVTILKMALGIGKIVTISNIRVTR